MKRFTKFLSVSLLLAILIPSVAGASGGVELKRLSGSSRVHTSIEISKEAYDTAKNVVLVGYNGEVDALTGSLLATNKQAPVIFVGEKYLSDVKKRLVELKTENVYILGGESVFPAKLFNEFKAYNPKRIKGDSRYETAVRIAAEAVGKTADEVFLALGTGNYADALAVGSVAAKSQKPLLLAGKGVLPKETKDALKSMEVKKVNIIGGTAAIPQAIVNELKALNIEVSRTSGNSREETAIAVAKEFNKAPSSIVLANGWKYADAVVAGYFTAEKDAVLLLSNTNKIHQAVTNYMSSNKVNTFILGGVNAIGSDIVNSTIKSNGASIVTDTLNITSTNVTSANNFSLTLDREVDSSKAKIEVKNGSTVISLSNTEFLQHSSVISLTTSADLKAGNYTVTISGVTAEPVIAQLKIDNKITARVSTEKQLNDALEDETIKIIELTKDISLNNSIEIARTVTIEGNGKTLKPFLEDSLAGIIVWDSNRVIINNLTVKGFHDNIEFFDSINCELNDVVLENAYNSGLLLYASQVKVNNITTKNNFFSGIDIMNDEEDTTSPQPKLTITGYHIHQSPIPNNIEYDPEITPAILLYDTLNNPGWVVGGNYVGLDEPDDFIDTYYLYDKKEYENWLANQ